LLTATVALKYHPDRNPGREQEVNTQFQIIQTAHEILSDPETKAKHDASRGRGRYTGASGVKGNPWSNVSAQYPPPPRRNNANANTSARTTPSGAQRWQTRFSSGVPPTAKQYAAADAESKKNAARAFENMRKGASAKTSEQTRPPPPPPPPRTESARQRAEASFGARKTGFHPRTTTGDEPPVSSSNYSSRPASERYAQSYGQEAPKQPPPIPQRPPPTAMPDPLSQFRDRDSWADPRQSSPYMSHGGEKTNPFDGIPLNRAKSTRETNNQGQSSDKEAFNRQRSASVPQGGRNDDGSSESSASQPSPIPRDPANRPKAPLKKTRSGFKSVPLGPNQQATEFPATETGK
jgi:curved DNA-binding protein CbpA